MRKSLEEIKAALLATGTKLTGWDVDSARRLLFYGDVVVRESWLGNEIVVEVRCTEGRLSRRSIQQALVIGSLQREIRRTKYLRNQIASEIEEDTSEICNGTSEFWRNIRGKANLAYTSACIAERADVEVEQEFASWQKNFGIHKKV